MDTSSDSWLEFLSLEGPEENRKLQVSKLGIFGHAPVFSSRFSSGRQMGGKYPQIASTPILPVTEALTCGNGLREGREKNRTPSARTAGDGKLEEGGKSNSEQPAQPPPALLASHTM